MRQRRKQSWVCDQCGEQFGTRKLLYTHKHEKHPFSGAWNKGLTKETDQRIAKQVKMLKRHISEGLVKNHWEGKHLPDEIRKKISASMKKPTLKVGRITLGNHAGTMNLHGPKSGS